VETNVETNITTKPLDTATYITVCYLGGMM
jgi:hypothetical protein